MIAALLAAAAVWLAWPTARRLPRRRARTASMAPTLVAVMAGMGFAIGGVLGLGIAGALAVVLIRQVMAASAREEGRRRDRQAQALPAVAALLAALLDAGSTIEASVGALARSHRGPLAPSLCRIDAAMRLGAGVDAWDAGSDVLEPIAQAMRRSAMTGAPAATLLMQTVIDEQRRMVTRAEIAARSAGVRALLPLIVCFLPAFLLVGVLPVIVSVAGSLLH